MALGYWMDYMEMYLDCLIMFENHKQFWFSYSFVIFYISIILVAKKESRLKFYRMSFASQYRYLYFFYALNYFFKYIIKIWKQMKEKGNII